MYFLQRLFGSFYSQTLYARVRTQDTGFGVGYSLALLALIAAICTLCLQFYVPETIGVLMPKLVQVPPEQWVMVAGATLLLRSSMLMALAVVAFLVARYWQMPMNAATAFRLSGVAYTPVAIMDAVALCTHGATMLPFIVFPCGVAMLLAALYATR